MPGLDRRRMGRLVPLAVNRIPTVVEDIYGSRQGWSRFSGLGQFGSKLREALGP